MIQLLSNELQEEWVQKDQLISTAVNLLANAGTSLAEDLEQMATWIESRIGPKLDYPARY